jgi:hypothetical protein
MLRYVSLVALLFCLTALAQIEITREGGAGFHCVDDSGDIVSSHAEEHDAVVACQNALLLEDVESEYSVVSSGRLRLGFSDAFAQLVLRIPPPEPTPPPGGLPAGWSETLIDGGVRTITSSDLTYTDGDGRWTITHTGGEVYSTADHFRAATYARTGDVTLTAKVVTYDSGTSPQPETGLMLRDSTAANSANVRISFSTSAARKVKTRLTTGSATTTAFIDAGSPTIPQCFRIEVDADIDSYRLFYSVACSSYTQMYEGSFSWLGGAYELALLSTPSDFGDAGWTEASVFESVVVSTAAVDHGVPDQVRMNPTSVLVDEDAGSVIVTAERIGDGPGACTMDYVVNDGTAVAGTDYTDESGTFSWADTEVGTKTESIVILDRAGNNGSRDFTVVISKNSCASDTLTDDTATVTINDTDGPTTLNWEAQTSASCPAGRETFYPGMRGFSACTRGGFVPGTTVHFITTTNPTGTGSIGAFFDASDPKVAVYSISGVVDHDGDTLNFCPSLPCSDVSIVGETAPSPGIIHRDVSFRPRTGSSGSDMTISHVTIGPGDQTNWSWDVDGLSVQANDFLAANVTLQWSRDETFDCWPGGSTRTNNSFWQILSVNPLSEPSGNPQGSPHGLHVVTNNLCVNFDLTRSVFSNADGRPRIRSGNAVAVANNVFYNSQTDRFDFQIIAQGCDKPTGGDCATHSDAGADPVDYNIINNLMITGPDYTGADNPPIVTKNPWNSASDIYEGGNSHDVYDCTTTACRKNDAGVTFETSKITAAWPTGMVEESFTVGNSGSELAFIDLIKDHVGSRPTDRWSTTETHLQQVVDGYTNHTAGGIIDQVSQDPAGGWPTFAENTVDHTDTAHAACGLAIPLDSSGDDIMTSGLTRLHETIICCHTDAVMPAGWRPDTLQLCTAP